MKAAILALMLISLTSLNSCSTCTPKTEYVDKIVYVEPIVPEYKQTDLPEVELNVWGDYAKYKLQCESLINSCNADKLSIINSLKENKSVDK